jgi:hypothetical protein
MLADIAIGYGTQQRIHNGMRQDIRVGVPQQPAFMRNLHAPHDQRPSRHQHVRVKTDPCPCHPKKIPDAAAADNDKGR